MSYDCTLTRKKHGIEATPRVCDAKYFAPAASAAANNVVKQDTFEYSRDKCTEFSSNDGKISAADKLKNLSKGFISPVTGMFSSFKNFILGASMMVGGAALISATKGAAAPVLVAAGVAGGSFELGKSALKASKADTDKEADEAWQGIGAGTSALALSAAGAKSSLKAAGYAGEASRLNVLSSTCECIAKTPISVLKSGKTLSLNKTVAPKKAPVKTEPPKQTQQLGTAAERVIDTSRLELQSNTPAVRRRLRIKPPKPVVFKEVKTSIFNKSTGEVNDAVLVYSKDKGGELIELMVDGERVGHTNYKIIKPNDREYRATPVKTYVKKGALFVDFIESNRKGAGTILHNAAIARSEELGYGGRVALEAVWNSHGFHYYRGFVPVGKNATLNEAAIIAAAEKAKATETLPYTRDLGSVYMIFKKPKSVVPPEMTYAELVRENRSAGAQYVKLGKELDDLQYAATPEAIERRELVEALRDKITQDMLLRVGLISKIQHEEAFLAIKNRINIQSSAKIVDKSDKSSVSINISPSVGKHAEYRLTAGHEGRTTGLAEVNINPEVEMVTGLPPNYVHGKSCLEIKYLATSNDYKGVGTELIKSVVKDSQKAGFEGRVYVEACGGWLPDELKAIAGEKMETTPVPFYYKKGFRFDNQRLNEQVAACLGSDVYNGPQRGIMYLPDEAIAAILNS